MLRERLGVSPVGIDNNSSANAFLLSSKDFSLSLELELGLSSSVFNRFLTGSSDAMFPCQNISHSQVTKFGKFAADSSSM